MDNSPDDGSLEHSPGEWPAVLDADDAPGVKVALLATLYFPGGHKPEVRAAVAACFERFQAEVGEHLRWARQPRDLEVHFLINVHHGRLTARTTRPVVQAQHVVPGGGESAK